jgi:hypothetical protein
MSKNEEPGDLELYWLVFVLLRISPSYELARKAAKGLLTSEEKDRLPRDFRKVTETYKLVGDVQRVRFRMWWAARGLRLFGSPGDAPSVQLLGLTHASEEPDTCSGIERQVRWFSVRVREAYQGPRVSLHYCEMPKPTREPHEHHHDPSWKDDDRVALVGKRVWNRKEVSSLDSETVRAGLQSGKARVLREFVVKDGTLFKPPA